MDELRYELTQLPMHLRTDWSLEVRLALRAGNGEWTVEYLVAIHNPECTQVASYFFDYGDTAFIREVVSGATLLNWIKEGNGRIRDREFVLQETDAQVTLRHVPSLYRWGLLSFQTPWFQHAIQRKDSPQRSPSGEMLIGKGLPLFPSYAEAVVELLYDYVTPPNLNQAPHDYILIVITDTTARFAGVDVFPHKLEIGISGRIPTPLSLHVTGTEPTLHAETIIEQADTYTVLLPNGTPRRLLCVLADGHRWVDRRHVDFSLGKYFQATDVHRSDQQENAAEVLQALIAQGEGPTLEFKQERSSHDDSWLRTVVAFANGAGGLLVFGVTDEGLPIGVPADARGLTEAITNATVNRIEPSIPIQVSMVALGKRELVVVTVPRGEHRPYALTTQNMCRYYHRVGATTFEARPEDIRLMVGARQDLNDRPTVQTLLGY